MNELINNIGGFNSYAFAILAIGCFVIGGVITGFWKWFFPLPFFGALLIFNYLIYIINESKPSENALIDGFSTVAPILFLVAALLTIYWVGFCKSPMASGKEKTR